MFSLIKESITNAIANNQFLSGGLVIGVLGGIAVYLRSVPSKIISIIKRKIILDIEIRSTEECFAWFLRWFNQQKFIQKSNHICLSVYWSDFNGEYGIKTSNEKERKFNYLFSPGLGNHFFSYKKRYFWLTRDRKESGDGGIWTNIETIIISTFRWNKKFIVDMLMEAKQIYFGKNHNGISLCNAIYGDWRQSQMVYPRSLDSVILPDDTIQDIVSDIDKFLKSKERYHEMGIPYHRGYLFSGSPGNGKTATIIAMAGYFNRPIFYLNLSKSSIGDLDSLFQSCMAGVFLVIEDIDTAAAAYRPDDIEKASDLKASFCSLINNLDGIGAPEGLLIFITTNHPENLDPALIRPGRIDRHIEFGNAITETAEKMILRFFTDANKKMAHEYAEDIEEYGDVSMAELQEALHSSETVFEAMKKIEVKREYKEAVNE